MKKREAVKLSLEQALQMPAKKVTQLPEGSEVDCGDGWFISRVKSSVRSGLSWVVVKEGMCSLGDYGSPERFWYNRAELSTFKRAYQLWLKNKDRLTDAEIKRILRQEEIDEEDSWG